MMIFLIRTTLKMKCKRSLKSFQLNIELIHLFAYEDENIVTSYAKEKRKQSGSITMTSFDKFWGLLPPRARKNDKND